MKKKVTKKSKKKRLKSAGKVTDLNLSSSNTLIKVLDYNFGRVFRLAGLNDELSVHATFIVLLGGIMMMDVT